jgi:hypothetical protein
VRDVVEAFRLLEVAMQQSATDHATGQLTLLGFFFLFCFPLQLLILVLMVFFMNDKRDD